MNYEGLIVISNPIALARKLAPGVGRVAELRGLERCNAEFRKSGRKACHEEEFYQYGRKILGWLGKIIDKQLEQCVNSAAQELVATLPYIQDVIQSDLSESIPAALCALTTYTTEAGRYTHRQPAEMCEAWLRRAARDEARQKKDSDHIPKILFQSHIDYFMSMGDKARSLCHARGLMWNWGSVIRRCQDKNKEGVETIVKELEEYENKNGINLGDYALNLGLVLRYARKQHVPKGADSC